MSSAPCHKLCIELDLVLFVRPFLFEKFGTRLISAIYETWYPHMLFGIFVCGLRRPVVFLRLTFGSCWHALMQACLSVYLLLYALQSPLFCFLELSSTALVDTEIRVSLHDQFAVAPLGLVLAFTKLLC